MSGNAFLTDCTTSHVDASALLVTGIYTERLPLISAYPVVTSAPLSTVARSLTSIEVPSTFFTVTFSSSLKLSTILFDGVMIALSPTLMFPAGIIELFFAIAVTNSSGVIL